MPDLGFYPESYLADAVGRNPVAFGQQQQSAIRALMDIADLSLLPFVQAEPELKKGLASQDPWQRYWALMVCSHFGPQAQSLSRAGRGVNV